MNRTGGIWKAALTAGAICCAALPAVGCGEAEPSGPTATLRVTRDFGRELIAGHDRAALHGRHTTLRLAQDNHDVEPGLGGGQWIEAIDGLKRRSDPERLETVWAANVNGVEADVSPLNYKLYDGDVVQLDLRRWYVTLDVRATVGAFPETFTRGVFGRQFPVTVRCEKPAAWACRHVKRLLRDAGVATDGSPRGRLPDPPNPQRARILVGAWKHWHDGEWAKRVDKSARASGVFARFTPNADALWMLDWNGYAVRREGAGTGLVAAMRPTEADLMWMITGVDDAGVEVAARALDSPDLRDAFAAVVTADGVEKVPLAADDESVRRGPSPDVVP